MVSRSTAASSSHPTPPFKTIGVFRAPGSIFRVTVFGILILLCAAAAVRLVAQEVPVFRARTEIVRLDLRVTDQHGRPVTDLRPDEIQITENGVRRPILLFRHLCDQQTVEPLENPLADLTTNALPTPGHVYVLVFDQLHIAPGHEQRAMIAAQDFILRQLKPGDAVAIYGLPGPGPAVNLTTDFARARRALEGVRGRAGRVAHPADQIADSEFGRQPGSNPGQVTIGDDDVVGSREVSSLLRGDADQMVAQGDTEVDIFLSSLARTMRQMRWIEGRKNLILFSEGFSADHASARLEQVASAAAESYTVIYPIDLGRRSVDIARASMPQPTLAESAQRREPLAALALETTGRLITDVNATTLQRALTAIASEADDYYLVGFEPGASDEPAKYRRVKVSIKRRGVVAHARTGYSMPAETSPAEERQAIDAAVFSPKVARALPIEYATYERLGSAPAQPRVILCLTADVHNSVEGGTADVVFVVRDERGAAVASGTDHVRLPAGGSRDGDLVEMPYRVQFDVPPGTYWMRVLVRDPAGVIGSADRRLHVWPLTGPGMTTSDLIISRLDGAGFDPPACAMVRRSDDVLAYLEIYGGAGLLKAAEARVDIVRPGSSEIVTTAEPIVAPGGHGETIVRARLPVGRLDNGDYAARVRIVAPNQAPRTVMRNFRVVTADAKGLTQHK